MLTAILLVAGFICAEPTRLRQAIVTYSRQDADSEAIPCLLPTSVLQADRVERHIDSEPISALTLSNVGFGSPVIHVFVTMLASAEEVSEQMIRGDSPWAPASALTAIAMAEAANAVAASVEHSDPTDLSPVTAEVAEMLERCEAASGEVKTSKVEVSRIIYNLVFETESRSEGELYFEAPDKRSVVLRGTKIPGGMKAARIARQTGQPFRLESGHDETWILTADEIAVSNDREKTYERYQRPTNVGDDLPGWRDLFKLRDASFPFLFEIRADDIRMGWTLTLQQRTEKQIILKGIPRTALLKRSFRACLVLIDDKTSQVTAVKFYDCTGNLEVVYKLGVRTINQPLPADCFDPELKWKAYKQFKVD